MKYKVNCIIINPVKWGVVVENVLNFNKAKENYDEVVKFSSYHPDLKKRQLELVKAKEALYTNELVMKYKKLEKEIQEKMNVASKEILKAISNNVK